MPVSVPLKYRRLVNQASDESGVPVPVEAAQIQTESDWDPDAVSPAGAEGIAQFEPGTWRQWGHGSPFNPDDAFPAYAAYMGSLLQQEGDSLRDALAAYNAGSANLPAGYGYADSILSEAGYKESAKGGKTPYADPFRDVQNLSPERVDMGVDYQGSGPVYALGPGVITESDYAWRGGVGAVGPGTFITEKLTSGPFAGHFAYLSENVTPQVTVGQQVDTSTVIGQMTGQGAGIETGWAAGPTGGTTAAMAAGQAATGGDPGAHPTAYGVAYSQILHDLGAPAGIITPPVVGKPPNWLSNIGKGLTGTAPPPSHGGLFGGIEDVATAVTSIGDTISSIEHDIEWWTVPSHWIRIFAGIGGSFFIIWGLWSMSRTGRAYSANVPVIGQVPVPEGGQLAPALGIAAVTIGSVGLFIAFHNLDAEGVTDFPSLLSYLQDRLQHPEGLSGK